MINFRAAKKTIFFEKKLSNFT